MKAKVKQESRQKELKFKYKMKKAFESKKSLWVQLGTQNRLEHIKEEDDDLVLESFESEEKPMSTSSTPSSFDPVKARSIRA